MNKTVLETLDQKKQELIAEKQKMVEQFDTQIKEVENAIKLILGDNDADFLPDFTFEDENPNYIKSSQEEI